MEGRGAEWSSSKVGKRDQKWESNAAGSASPARDKLLVFILSIDSDDKLPEVEGRGAELLSSRPNDGKEGLKSNAAANSSTPLL